MAFVSSPSTNSTNEVYTVYGVSPASTQSSTASTQLVHEDIEQIHKDGLEEIDLKWKLALLSMRSVTTTTRCDILQESAEGLGTKIAKNRYQDSSKRTVHVEETPPKAMVVIDGVGFDWSYMAEDEVSTNMALMAFLDSEFESYRPKYYEIESKNASEDIPNELKEYSNAPLVKDRVLDNKDCSVESHVVVEKKTIVLTIAKVVRPKQQEKPVRKEGRYAEMYRSQGPKGNQRNWNNLKSQQLRINTARPSPAVVNTVRANKGHPQKVKEYQGYVDIGCFRHMTRNISYLSDFKKFDGGYVTFGEGC
uniref:Uncharacterized protein n=1 Tax=Tanacetum cinerariifolium TaxID=118510 RepID=A0A699HNN9_TANCI|nr:hypothetical protein [Tanacetum cinerariifolium]